MMEVSDETNTIPYGHFPDGEPTENLSHGKGEEINTRRFLCTEIPLIPSVDGLDIANTHSETDRSSLNWIIAFCGTKTGAS